VLSRRRMRRPTGMGMPHEGERDDRDQPEEEAEYGPQPWATLPLPGHHVGNPREDERHDQHDDVDDRDSSLTCGSGPAVLEPHARASVSTGTAGRISMSLTPKARRGSAFGSNTTRCGPDLSDSSRKVISRRAPASEGRPRAGGTATSRRATTQRSLAGDRHREAAAALRDMSKTATSPPPVSGVA
jgi:hypothetical protein